MRNWNYFELIASLYKSFFLYKEQGDSSEKSIARMGLDFWFFPEEENVLENLLLINVTLSISLSLFKKVDDKMIRIFEKQLSLINNEFLSLNLNDKEMEHLTETIDEIKYKIKMMNST